MSRRKKPESAAKAAIRGEVTTRPLGTVKPNPWNPNRMTDAEMRSLEHGFKEDGWLASMALTIWGVDDQGVTQNLVIDGEHRWHAAQKLGIKEGPMVFLDGLTRAQAQALTVKLDKKRGKFSETALADLLKEIVPTMDRDLAGLALGFSDSELAALLKEGRAKSPDVTPPVEKNVITAPGDVWVIGRHRLICGDSEDQATVQKVLAGATPRLMVTDPPYGVEYDPAWRAEAGLVEKGTGRLGVVENDHKVDWRKAYALSPASVVYCWHDGRFASTVQAGLESCGFEIRGQIIWAKARLAISRGHYHWQHESCWYAVRKGDDAKWIGDRKQVTLWNIESDETVEGGHSTQKPVECMERPIRNHEGDVYEPFAGSGTTFVAAQKQGRRCYGIELKPEYCDVIVRRLQNFLGVDAVHEASGRIFGS